MPPHPGGHLHCPLYSLQRPNWPHVKAGNRQLKHGGHLSCESENVVDDRSLRDRAGVAEPVRQVTFPVRAETVVENIEMSHVEARLSVVAFRRMIEEIGRAHV